MNRLLAKIREFGFIFSIPTRTTKSLQTWSEILGKYHFPLILLSQETRGDQALITMINERYDLFIGADCPYSREMIDKSFASGAHFTISKFDYNIPMETKFSIDSYTRVSSVNEIKMALDFQASAVVISQEEEFFSLMLDYCMENQIPFLVEGTPLNVSLDKFRCHKNFIALIITLPGDVSYTNEMERIITSTIKNFLKLRFRSLTLAEGSNRQRDAEIFTAFTAIPIIENGKKECLEIETADMDRTIAYLKWHHIFIDPLTTRMNGDFIVSTEFYDQFLGWHIRLSGST